MAENVALRIPDELRDEVEVGSRVLTVLGQTKDGIEVGHWEVAVLDGDEAIATLLFSREVTEGLDA